LPEGIAFHCFFIQEFQKQKHTLKDWVMDFRILFKKKKKKITKRERLGLGESFFSE
jgi:hypothetical protein